jgi:hypothetical protein
LGYEQAKKRRGAKRAFLRKLPKTAIWRIVLTDHARLPACAKLELTECPAFEPGFLYPIMTVPVYTSIAPGLRERARKMNARADVDPVASDIDTNSFRAIGRAQTAIDRPRPQLRATAHRFPIRAGHDCRRAEIPQAM